MKLFITTNRQFPQRSVIEESDFREKMFFSTPPNRKPQMGTNKFNVSCNTMCSIPSKAACSEKDGISTQLLILLRLFSVTRKVQITDIFQKCLLL